MKVWQSVKAAPTHSRGGDETGSGAQAGVVVASDPAKTEVVVKWDVDSVTEAVEVADLIALS